jgi:hypothetical protein
VTCQIAGVPAVSIAASSTSRSGTSSNNKLAVHVCVWLRTCVAAARSATGTVRMSERACSPNTCSGSSSSKNKTIQEGRNSSSALLTSTSTTQSSAVCGFTRTNMLQHGGCQHQMASCKHTWPAHTVDTTQQTQIPSYMRRAAALLSGALPSPLHGHAAAPAAAAAAAAAWLCMCMCRLCCYRLPTCTMQTLLLRGLSCKCCCCCCCLAVHLHVLHAAEASSPQPHLHHAVPLEALHQVQVALSGLTQVVKL